MGCVAFHLQHFRGQVLKNGGQIHRGTGDHGKKNIYLILHRLIYIDIYICGSNSLLRVKSFNSHDSQQIHHPIYIYFFCKKKNQTINFYVLAELNIVLAFY